MNTENSIHLKTDLLTYLEHNGFITPDQSHIIKLEIQRKEQNIEQLLVTMNFIASSTLMQILSQKDNISTIDIKFIDVKLNIARKLTKEYCIKNNLLCFDSDEENVYIAITQQLELHIKDQLKHYYTGKQIVYMLANQQQLLEVIEDTFSENKTITHWMQMLDQQYSIDESFAINILSALLTDCVKKRASDIHFEPEEFFVRIRVRIDGVLSQLCIIPKDKWKNLCVRIKILANMDISHTLSSQDGHFTMQIFGKAIDMRISTHPVVHGENTVIRILDKQKALIGLDKLGYTSTDMSQLDNIMQHTHGIFIVTGPTGAGKSTLMCGMLLKMHKADISITTIEDPVEYSIPYFRQTDLHQYKQMTIASAARSILRQDPDIISISEMRDNETANIAMRAAMTGRLVLTTLHTSDIFGVFDRMEDMGINKNLLSSHLTGIVNQRLIRRLCDKCKKVRNSTEDERKILGYKYTEICDAVGCEACRYTGYNGRMAVAQILNINHEIRDILLKHDIHTASKILYNKGHVNLLDDAMKYKIYTMETTLDEVNRIHLLM